MLKISRQGISSTEITEYPVQDRLVKVPFENYLKTIKSPMDPKRTVFDDLNPPQIALINAIQDPRFRFIVGCISRRLGKTFIVNLVINALSLMPNQSVLIIAPSFSLSSISFHLQKALLKELNLETERVSEKDRIIDLPNGSSIRIASTRNVDACIGRSYNLIVWDESAIDEANQYAYEQQLRPTLDRPGSKSVWISTPRGFNFFKDFYERGFDDRYPEWVSVWADYHENQRMTEADIAEAQQTMSKQMFDQEYRGLFTSYEGQVYTMDPDKQVQPYERQDEDEFIASIDPGYKDPTGFLLLAYRDSNKTWYVVKEYLEKGRNTAEHVAFWNEIYNNYPVSTTFIDAASLQLANDLAQLYNISSVPAKKDVLPGIASVQTIIEQGRLIIDPSCEKTILGVLNYSWKQGSGNMTRERTVHDIHSHLMDCLRYAIYTLETGG